MEIDTLFRFCAQPMCKRMAFSFFRVDALRAVTVTVWLKILSLNNAKLMVPPVRISWCALAALLEMWPRGRAQEGFETYYVDGFGTYYVDGGRASETFETSRG